LPLLRPPNYCPANICQIPYEEIESFDEVLAAGTAAALVPIKSITVESKGQKFTYGTDEPGEVCIKLLSTLKGIQQGKIEDKFGWRVEVEKPAQWGTHGEGAQKETVDELP
jgi:branched-chain amino acid aminotransferase